MKNIKERSDINLSFVKYFEENADKLNYLHGGFIKDLRLDAMHNFDRLGIPGKKSESYKYTALDSIFNPSFSMQLSPSKVDFNVEDIFTCDVPNLKTRLEIILNGFYFSRGPLLTKLSNGIVIGSLAEASRKYPDLVQSHYSKYANYQDSSLVALNTAFSQDGLFIYLPKNTRLEHPVQVVHLPMTGLDTLLQYRNLIILEDNSEGEIIVCDHTLSPFKSLTNSVSEIFVGPGATFNYSRVQNEHLSSNLITNVYIHQKADSHVTSNTITLHGGLVRNNTYVNLNGKGCDNRTYGLFFADRKQHIDNFISISHTMPGCTSRQLFKGILDDQATGAFSGHILVKPDAQQTNAFQTNNNILLSDEARMNSKPQLEIYADDVKCSHGATTGRLDENSLFYLQSRGIHRQEAKLLMLYAFVFEVIDKISVLPLKDRINHLVDKRLRGELSRCNNCSMNCGEIQTTPQ